MTIVKEVIATPCSPRSCRRRRRRRPGRRHGASANQPHRACRWVCAARRAQRENTACRWRSTAPWSRSHWPRGRRHARSLAAQAGGGRVTVIVPVCVDTFKWLVPQRLIRPTHGSRQPCVVQFSLRMPRAMGPITVPECTRDNAYMRAIVDVRTLAAPFALAS